MRRINRDLVEAARPTDPVETFHTIPQAAQALGIRTHALRSAITNGLISYYTPFGARRLVKLSEIVAAIESHRVGGLDNG